MTRCTRKDISEKLIMALWPEDFQDQQPEIIEHLRECADCRKELEMLRQVHGIITENSARLTDAVSQCPSPESIVEAGTGQVTDPAVERHAEFCPVCREELALVRDLSREDFVSVQPASLSAEDKLVIHNAVLKEYGPAKKAPSSSSPSFFRSFLSGFNITSMLTGAVVAALLVVALVPWESGEAPSRLVLSDARWESPQPGSMTKGGDMLMQPLVRPSAPPKRVALILLAQDAPGLSTNEVAQLYGRVNLARRVGGQYEFISPADIKKALQAAPDRLATVPDAARMVFDRTDADYVLAFRIGGSDGRLVLAGSLFERPQKKLLGFAAWDGVSKGRLSEKVILIGTELLSGAEES